MDKDLIVSKEDFLKSNFINSVKSIVESTNENNIDSNILEIKETINNFNLITESATNIEENIITEKTIKSLKKEKIIHYSLEKSAFKNLSPFITNSLITIGAESSVGKTSFTSQLVLDILKENKDTILAFYSLDDSKNFLLSKMLTQLENNYNIITSGRVAIFECLKIYNFQSELLKLIENAKEKLKIKNPRLLVVIDYLQIIDHESYNLREGLNKVCKDLKNIQKSLKCTMLLISQFNRQMNLITNAMSKVNTLSRYRETSEIENVSDLCINLEAVKSLKKKSYNTKIYIVKNKRGEKDIIFISMRNNYTFSTFVPKKLKNSIALSKSRYYNAIEKIEKSQEDDDLIF